MSFGEGNLREALVKANERAEMYRRQLGGMTKARNRERQKAVDLQRQVDEKQARIEQLERFARDLLEAM